MKNMMTNAIRITIDPNTMKPVDKNMCWNSLMVAALLSWGPFRAIITEPTYSTMTKIPEGPMFRRHEAHRDSTRKRRRTMHRKQPHQPKKVRVSLRNIEDKIAHMTTESAPRGVTMMAGMKA